MDVSSYRVVQRGHWKSSDYVSNDVEIGTRHRLYFPINGVTKRVLTLVVKYIGCGDVNGWIGCTCVVQRIKGYTVDTAVRVDGGNNGTQHSIKFIVHGVFPQLAF